MLCIESIEPRTLFTTTGLDSTFGAGGVVGLPYGGGTGTELAVDGAVFVEVHQTLQEHFISYIYRYDDKGKLDTAWGNGGRIRFGMDVQQMAYNGKTGTLYAAGTNSTNSGGEEGVLFTARYTATGLDDTTFGTRGVTTYVPSAPAKPSPKSESSASISTIEGLTVLPHQQLLVSFERSTSVTDHSQTGFPIDGQNELVLMRLKAGGGRDTSFGKQGMTTVLSGTYQERTTTDLTIAKTTPALGQLQLRSDGSYRVVASELSLTTHYNTQVGGETSESEGFTVESRVITAAGKIDTASNGDWTLLGSETDEKERIIDTKLVTAMGDNNAAVVAEIEGASKHPSYQIFDLTPGQRITARALPIADVAALTDVIRTPLGDYFAFTSTKQGTARYVTKLTDALTLQPKWGVNGVTMVDNFYKPGVGDYDGDLLVFSGNTVYRLDGIV